MKLRKPGLLVQIVAAAVIGALIGLFLPGCAIRALNTFKEIFGEFIKFMVPLIVVGLVTPAIADTGRSAGRLILLTMAIAAGSTVFSGYFSFFLSKAVLSNWIDGGFAGVVAAGREYPSYFIIKIPPLADIVTALVFSFMTGLGIVAAKAERLAGIFSEFREIVTLAIQKAFVPLLPLYILGVVADLTACGKLAAVAGPCIKIMVSCVAFTTLLLLLQYSFAGLVVRRNPLKALWNMVPAYLTGCGCCSSAATIPVTLGRTLKNGVSSRTAELVVPLCSSVHLAGSMCNMVAYAAGIIFLYGGSVEIVPFTEFILMLSIIAVASPGIPCGVVFASAAIVETALGFTPERYALMVAMYTALDGMGTACNLTGDGAIALVVDKFASRVGSR